ncbi:hypothetical protein GCM10027073_63160 [Streptomyces chlorus]|uniref:Uncharacterized protein n=1 Tax=Streptomyces chlorus TaxID=887452 RepID=A0ABW1DZ66_9ACTN
MSSAPIVVHRPFRTRDRTVTVRRHSRDEILDTAYSDHDLASAATGNVRPVATPGTLPQALGFSPKLSASLERGDPHEQGAPP